MLPHHKQHYELLLRLKDYDFSEYQYRVVREIADRSYGMGVSRAWLPTLKCFAELTRISKGNVSSTLESLIRALVIEECGPGLYAIKLPVEGWRIPPRLNWTGALQEMDAWLRRGPESELGEPGEGRLGESPSISQALRELAGLSDFPAACRRGAMRDRRDASRSIAAPDAGASGTVGVPESGTVGGTRCVPAAVPESGTYPTFRRLNVPSEERLTSKRLDVPESGTPKAPIDGLREKVRAFVGERDYRRYWERDEEQAIFDDPLRSEVLWSSLRYCQAGIKEGIQVRKNTGSMLWSDYRRSLAAKLSRVR